MVRCDLSRTVFHRALCSGPSSLISYSEDVVIVFNAYHHVLFHIFADDKQLFASALVAEAHEAKKTVEQCVAAIKDCASRRLKLNDGKTEVIWLGTRPRLQHLAGVDLNLSVRSDIIRPSIVVRDLGVFVDAELTFREHVRRITQQLLLSTSPSPPNSEARQPPSHEAVGARIYHQNTGLL